MPNRFRRRRLPHLDIEGATYFVTACLAGSIPSQGRLDLIRYETDLDQRRPTNLTAHEWQTRRWKLVFAKTDKWLDEQPAVRHLADERLARAVVKSMFHFANVRYDLLAYVVMPSHFHWVFRPLESWTTSLPSGPDDPTPREVIMHSLKRFTARECNALLGLQGAFWQDESYDHCVRDDESLLRIIAYIEQNPVKARLVDQPNLWPFSSAHKVGQVFNLP